jgi:GTP pyrophosphokinase
VRTVRTVPGAYGAVGAECLPGVCRAYVYPVDVAEDPPTKTQLDKLGERLREGSTEEADLRALDNYRRSFRPAYDQVVRVLKKELQLEGTGRPAKTTVAIVEKLKRQKIRLTQIQDIAGVRLLVGDLPEQNRIVQALRGTFSDISIDDRRVKPSHGYRAVHVVVLAEERLVEVQVRTPEQHLWAELSEKLSDVVDPALKYGGGPADTRQTLLEYSSFVSRIEELETLVVQSRAELVQKEVEIERLDANDPSTGRKQELLKRVKQVQEEHEAATRELKESLASLLIDYYNQLVTPES